MKLLETILGYQVDRRGVVKESRTGKVITIIADPNKRQRRRYAAKQFKKQLAELGKAAAYAIHR